MKSLLFPTTERFLGGETVRYRDLAKTGLFPTTERVLPPFPTTPTTGFPYTGERFWSVGWGRRYERTYAEATTRQVSTGGALGSQDCAQVVH